MSEENVESKNAAPTDALRAAEEKRAADEKRAGEKSAVGEIKDAAVDAVQDVKDTANQQAQKTSVLARFLLTNVFWTTIWRLFSIALILAAIVGLWKLLFGKSTPPLKLDDGQYMRGLITIVLLFVSLALVAVIILTSLFADNDEATAKRVALSREVITPLFGILGTIIGFYFGAATVSNARDTAGPTPPTPTTQTAPAK